MCERCNEITRDLDRSRVYQASVNDPLAITLWQLIIEELQEEKNSLHPAREPEKE